MDNLRQGRMSLTFIIHALRGKKKTESSFANNSYMNMKVDFYFVNLSSYKEVLS